MNIQRSALFEQWFEIRDMIATIDRMMEIKNTEQDNHAATYIYELA
ncbi:hypothetical protein CV093_19615 [Oceanobacillus sp. 143]|nr:hypothetical protein [Oceanobacillus zhaokaii]QGS69670.1 hypothetical protein CV093_19615 [Oceanobacillus sp. 143]